LLQDAVYPQEAIPNLFLWKHPIFHCPEFNAFAVQLKDAVSLSSVPQEERLHPAVPLIANKLRDMSTIMTDHHNSLNAMLNSHKEMHAQFHHRMADVFSGRSRLQILSDSFPESNSEVDLRSPIEENIQCTGLTKLPLPLPAVNAIPAYKLSRDLTTVTEVWNEYTVDIGYNPSVKHMEDTYGTKWRRHPSEQRYFSRRKILYDRVKELIVQGYTERDAVQELETLRKNNNLTLDALQKKNT